MWLEIVPATYGTESETILIRPEQTIQTIIPAKYGTETKQVLVAPAHVVWKVGRGLYEKIDSATGEIMCRVQIPAKYETVINEYILKYEDNEDAILKLWQ